jgi:hypothetical protein
VSSIYKQIEFMKKPILAIVLIATIVTSGATLAQAESYQAAFRTCESLRNSTTYYMTGVSSSTRTVGFTGAGVNATLYQENRKLDIDNDGVACELAIYDLNVTKTTVGVSSAYSACKAYRSAEQNAASLYGQIDRYWNTTDFWLVQLAFMKQSADLMKQASSQNNIFLKGANSAKAMSDYYSKSYILSIAGKEIPQSCTVLISAIGVHYSVSILHTSVCSLQLISKRREYLRLL